MRVLMLSKACVVGAYQRKLEEIAAHPDVELIVAVPPEWRDERGTLKLERAHTRGYRLVVEPLALNGSFHMHFYPGVGRLLNEIQPDLVHLDEEPYNFATWHALRLARRRKVRTLFFSWQNLNRRYPFPFSAFEAFVLRHSDYAICGSREAEAVWRAKGYPGPTAVIPQFGIDPELYAPRPSTSVTQSERDEGASQLAKREARGGAIVIGYAGRFVPEKGIDRLIRACARLRADYELVLIGSGPSRGALLRLGAECGLGGRLTVRPWLSSAEFPGFLRGLDVLVLPSVSQPHWKEQFGRVLVEAMACGVPVVGSDCGEIPNVVGDAGLIVPEGNVEALAEALARLQGDPALREELRARGRERALACFTQQRVAAATVAVYREILTR